MVDFEFGVDHFGLMVHDLELARRFLVDELGFVVEREISIERRLKASVLRHDQTEIELIEPAGDGARAKDEGPQAHIAFRVENLDLAIAALRRRGVETTRPEASVVGATRSYFTRPNSTGGVVCQFLETIYSG